MKWTASGEGEGGEFGGKCEILDNADDLQVERCAGF